MVMTYVMADPGGLASRTLAGYHTKEKKTKNKKHLLPSWEVHEEEESSRKNKEL